MVRMFLLIIFAILLTSCSVDTKTGFWENKKKPNNIKKLSEIKFDYDLSFNQFKKNVIEYGKRSKYPKLD